MSVRDVSRGTDHAELGRGAMLTLGRLRRALIVNAAAILAACGTDSSSVDLDASEDALAGAVDASPLPPEVDDAVTRTPWTTLGVGVGYKGFDADVPASRATNALIVYGGYTALDEYVRRWANQLYRVKGAALGIRHLYAVRGPNQAGYANREIQNSKLVAHLASDDRAANANAIVVVAHSSGTYVADELFSMIERGSGGVPSGTLGKVRLFNLDGGGVASAPRLNRMARAYFVYAHDPSMGRSSHNASAMKSLGRQFASLGGAVEVVATRSGCSATAPGGLWCLHDAMINSRPHNPTSYDLRNDYTVFTGEGRELVTAYFDDVPPSTSADAEQTADETADLTESRAPEQPNQED